VRAIFILLYVFITVGKWQRVRSGLPVCMYVVLLMYVPVSMYTHIYAHTNSLSGPVLILLFVQLYGDQERHDEMRQNTVEYMQQNRLRVIFCVGDVCVAV